MNIRGAPLSSAMALVLRKDFTALKDTVLQVGNAASALQRELPGLDATLKRMEMARMMSQPDAQQLLLAMDRLTKLMAMISSLLKQSSETQRSIIQNLKA
jgi:hypothetical protein